MSTPQEPGKKDLNSPLYDADDPRFRQGVDHRYKPQRSWPHQGDGTVGRDPYPNKTPPTPARGYEVLGPLPGRSRAKFDEGHKRPEYSSSIVRGKGGQPKRDAFGRLVHDQGKLQAAGQDTARNDYLHGQWAE